MLRSDYLLHASEGKTRSRAERREWTGTIHRFLFDSSQVQLRKKALFLREIYLIRSDPEKVCSIYRQSGLSRCMTVELENSANTITREVLFFMIWMALMIHRKNGTGAA